MIRLLAVLKNTVKWPGRDSPGKGGFPRLAWSGSQLPARLWDHYRQPSLGPPGRSPLLWAAEWHLRTSSPCPLCKGTLQPGMGHPSSSLACAVMQFLHKSTRQRKKQNNKQCPGPMPAVQHSSYIGKVGPTSPLLLHHGQHRHPCTPGCPSSQHQPIHRAPLRICTSTGTPRDGVSVLCQH